jgi:hypothetical protein
MRSRLTGHDVATFERPNQLSVGMKMYWLRGPGYQK